MAEPTTQAPSSKKLTPAFHGRRGSSFSVDLMQEQLDSVDGVGFGDFQAKPNFVPPGTVTLNGQPLLITRWRNDNIKGELPEDAKPGEVVVQRGDSKWTTKFTVAPEKK